MKDFSRIAASDISKRFFPEMGESFTQVADANTAEAESLLGIATVAMWDVTQSKVNYRCRLYNLCPKHTKDSTAFSDRRLSVWSVIVFEGDKSRKNEIKKQQLLSLFSS